jgi:DNA-binding transcriptional regulator of glucitol operon
VHRRFASPRWVAPHVLVLALVAAFLRLGWWQLRRAGQGNPLSFGYALEWPVFAAFTVFVWYRAMRDSIEPPAAGADRPGADPATPERATPGRAGSGRSGSERGGAPAFPLPTLPPRPQVAAGQDEDDPVLAAYNRYLDELARNDRGAG